MASSSTTTNVHLTQGEKPEKFNGTDFKRWQQKMLFYLTTLSLTRFLKEDPQVIPEDEVDPRRRAVVDAWNQSDFLCKNYILNGLDNILYNVYSQVKTAKKLWETLEKKYKAEDAGLKKFIVERFLDFKMVDSMSVVSQVQELQVILHEIHAEGMSLSESFQVAVLIEKLLPMWKEFKNYLKHKRKEMGLEDLIVRLRIREDNRKLEIHMNKMTAKANMVESNNNNAFNGKKRKFKAEPQQQKNPKKFKGNYFNYGKPNHMAKDCRCPKKRKEQANIIQERQVLFDLSELDLTAVVFETNLVDNPNKWWVDMGATRHICSDKVIFSTYTQISGRKLFMENSAHRTLSDNITFRFTSCFCTLSWNKDSCRWSRFLLNWVRSNRS